MKLKQIFSAILILCMFFSTSAFADEAKSSELTKVILEVKSRIHIPDEYSEFEYYYSQNDFKEGIYNFTWSQTKDNYKAISINADSLGNITGYYKYEDERKMNSSLVLTEQEAITIATEFLYKVNQTTVNRFVFDKVENSIGNFQINFKEIVNNIPVKSSYCSVSVNKNTKEIISLNLSRNYSKESFADPSAVISMEKAKEAYISKIGIKTNYMLYYNREDKTITGFPVYNPEDYGNYAIDALTGEKIKVESLMNFYGGDDHFYEKSKLNEAAAGSGLTEVESIEVDNTLKLLSSNEALEKVNQYFAKENPFTLNNASLRRNYFNNESYQWNISAVRTDKNQPEGKIYCNATVNASNGTILSYYCYENIKTEKKISREDAFKKVTGILNQNAGELVSKYKLEEPVDTAKSENHIFNFVRYENGIKVNGNRIYLEVASDGTICSYRIQYDEKINFKPLKIINDDQKVLSAFSKNANFTLCYYPVKKYDESLKKEVTTIHLIYDFMEAPMILDPENLIQLDYKGEPYKEDVKPQYEDISDHWVKNTIDLLSYNAFYMIEENKFQPEKMVSQSEFLTYIFKADYLEFDNIDKLYEYALRSKIILESEIDKNGAITRKSAAKFLVRKLNFESLTKRPEIYLYPYSDHVDQEYKPYIAICYSLYLLNGDNNNNFNPDNSLTRAECAVIILNMFKINQF